MNLRTELITDLEQLSATCRKRWNDLAKNPFQSWDWLGSWAESFVDSGSLAVLKVMRGDQIVGIAPFCLENRLASGRTLVFLGSGKASSDHLSIIAEEGLTREVSQSAAEWLAGETQDELAWDLIELIGANLHDVGVDFFVEALRKQDVQVELAGGLARYAIDLPSSWDEYVKLRSKSGRREIRQAMRNIECGRITVEQAETPEQLSELWTPFVELHQRRRVDSGTDHCFEHPHFESFLRRAAERLLAADRLRFIVASVDGQPAAVHFAIVDDLAWYFYQSGMEPSLASLRPGLSLFCDSICQSIHSGRQTFDMLRGDEPYKSRWRATLRPTQQVRAFHPRLSSTVRGRVVRVGTTLKSLLHFGQSQLLPGHSTSSR